MTFKRFDAARLRDMLVKHPVSSEGLEFISQALEKPSRNVSGTTKNVVSDVPCPKMIGNSQSESWRTERPFNLEYIFDENVVGYVNQLPKLELHYKGRNGRTVRVAPRLDCLRMDWHEGFVAEEWKSSGDRERLLELYPGRYERLGDGTYLSPVFSAALNPWGLKFRIRFSDELGQIAQRNRIFLYSYLGIDAEKEYGHKVKQFLKQFFSESNCETYSALVGKGADRDLLNFAIAFGYLFIDFDQAPIKSYPSRVFVFKYKVACEAWKQAIRPRGDQPKLSAAKKIRGLVPGDKFSLDGVHITVSHIGKNSIFGRAENGHDLSLGIDELNRYHKTGCLVLPGIVTQNRSASKFWSASPKNLARAIKRLEILKKIELGITLEKNEEYSDSTYRRWRKAIVVGKTVNLSPVESLLDDDGKGYRGAHVHEKFSKKLNDWIFESLRDNLHQTIQASFDSIKKKAEAEGYTMIARSSFYERYNKLKTVRSVKESEGYKKASQLEPTFWMLEKETPIHCERAFELVHFDSTLLDIELRSSISGDVLGRAWLSLAMCAFTRAVLGMYLSYFPPSYVSSMMLLADIVIRHGRLPEAIIHDWGSEFKAKDWKEALTCLNIIRHVRPKSRARFGAILERMFGVVTKELLDNIAGNTKIRKNVRELTPKVDPSVHSGLWISDLYTGLEEYFFGIHNDTKHTTTLRVPNEACESSFLSDGNFAHRLRNFEDIMPLLMPRAKGKPRSIDPTRGIFVNSRYYGHPYLTKLSLKNSGAIVKPVPLDPGIVLAFLKGEWQVCKTGIHPDIKDVPEYIRRSLFEEFRIEQRLIPLVKTNKKRKIIDLIEELNKKALNNVEYWRDKKYKELTSIGDFNTHDSSPRQDDAYTRLDLKMKMAVQSFSKSSTKTYLLG